MGTMFLSLLLPFLLQAPKACASQHDVHESAQISEIIVGSLTTEYLTLPAEEDPLLQQMPNTTFKAYVHPEISTLYNLTHGSMIERKPEFTGQACKFSNLSPDALTLVWRGPDGEFIEKGKSEPWGNGGTACYPHQTFAFTTTSDDAVSSEVVSVFTVLPGVSVYYHNPYETALFAEQNHDPARGIIENNNFRRSLDALSSTEQGYYNAHVYNLEFGSMYKQFTGGIEWLAMQPTRPPKHWQWRADFFGQTHTISTEETHFHQPPPPEQISNEKLSIAEMRQDAGGLPFADHRGQSSLNLTLTAISCAPRAFEIPHFLSDVEVDYMIELLHQYDLSKSSGSETRTSTSTWWSRDSDPVLNAIFRRAADVLNVDEALLRQRDDDELNDITLSKEKVNEDLQLLHYNTGQHFTPHFDFSYYKGPESKHKTRSLNLCMYLNDVPAGGETSFLKWRNAETDQAMNVKPEKGKAMLFYMVTPDGNLDPLSQHAGLPPTEGDKYFANLWISDF